MAGRQLVLVVDNYDSFTYNLVQCLAELGADTRVWRNDEVTPAAIDRLHPDRIVLSPGPGAPEQAGRCLEVVERFAGRMPILGVCLGHQTVARVFGGVVGRAPAIMHGKVSAVHHDGQTVYAGLSSPFAAMRYHSLIVERDSLPPCLEVSAWTVDGLVMGLRHRTLAVEGVQFHPESCLTPTGSRLLANFLAGQGDNPQRLAPEAPNA
jgi:anthranilate synthase/aminodeoxychorismate synthase-like glutamine amidotransferase